MESIKQILVIAYLIFYFNSVVTKDLPGLQSIFNFFVGNDFFKKLEFKETDVKIKEEFEISEGRCNYNFVNYVSFKDKEQCELDDKYILHFLEIPQNEKDRKLPVTVNCQQIKSPDNEIDQQNSLLILETEKDILSLLKPLGNTTKRHEPGSCVLIFFYTESSLGCAQIATYAHRLPRLFPSLKIAAIDALKYSKLNTEYGIIGLPTVLLFHQGRPVVKFYSDVGTFAEFITKHTGIKPLKNSSKNSRLNDGPLPLEPIANLNYILFLAWTFLLSSGAYYSSRSRLYVKIIETIKRNWRESEARLESN